MVRYYQPCTFPDQRFGGLESRWPPFPRRWKTREETSPASSPHLQDAATATIHYLPRVLTSPRIACTIPKPVCHHARTTRHDVKAEFSLYHYQGSLAFLLCFEQTHTWARWTDRRHQCLTPCRPSDIRDKFDKFDGNENDDSKYARKCVIFAKLDASWHSAKQENRGR